MDIFKIKFMLMKKRFRLKAIRTLFRAIALKRVKGLRKMSNKLMVFEN